MAHVAPRCGIPAPARRRLAIALLLAAGVALTLGTPASPSIASTASSATAAPAWDPTCYSTYEQVVGTLEATAAAHPEIASVVDAGGAWEGGGARRVWALRLGRAGRMDVTAPGVLLVAGQHPRDISTTAIALRLVGELAAGYGVDAGATWLLENRSVLVVPVANPDGYFRVYNDGLSQYKNRDNAYCANSINRGADTNRNFPYMWNTVGTSGLPCDLSYPGAAALSEPETAALVGLVGSVGGGVVLNLQAEGVGGAGEKGVLYPWGYTATPAPDAGGLFAMGWAMARRSGTPQGGVMSLNEHGPISGVIDDTAYNNAGAAAFTLLVGPGAPLCTDLEGVWAAQRGALMYAIAAAGDTRADTLSHALGPDPVQVGVVVGSGGVVTATAAFSANVGTVAGAVYSVDEPGPDGWGAAMQGGFGGGTAQAWARVDTGGLAPGRHTLFVQGVGSSGDWGVKAAAFFTATGGLGSPTPTVTRTVAPTSTGTPTAPLPSGTPTLTPTGIASTTPTRTATHSATATSTSTSTRTASATASATPSIVSGTPSYTPTPTHTPSRTPSSTRTLTPTRTPTNTRTPTLTRTPTVTRTSTVTRTPTPALTPSGTRTPSSTRTTTPTRTPSLTATPRPPNTATPLPCATFSDVHPSNYFYRAVDWLVCRGIVSGYPDGTFRPYNTATRAQIVKMVVLGEEWPLLDPPNPRFTDVLPGDWCYSYVETAAAHGALSGYPDGAFRPANSISRGQLSKVIVLARGWTLLDPPVPSFTDVPLGSTFYTHIETARWHGVVSGYGDNTFHPSEPAFRGQLAKMLFTALTQPGGP